MTASLMRALTGNMPRYARGLIMHGIADPDEPDGHGLRPVDVAMGEDLPMLCELGADINRSRTVFLACNRSHAYGIQRLAIYDALGASLWRSPFFITVLRKRRTVFELVLCFPKLPRGMALRVVEWALKC